MLINSRAIVLRTIKHSDSTLIVDAYTEKEGRRSFATNIPKTRKASIKKVLFSPMALLEIEWNDHGQAKLTRLKSARPAYIYESIPFSPAKMSQTMFLAEFLAAALRAPIADEKIFEFAYTSMLWLDSTDAPSANFHIVFLLHLSSLLGLQPNTEDFAPSRFFDMDNGVYQTQTAATANAIAPEEARHLPMLLKLKYSTASKIRFTRLERSRMLKLIIQYYSIHIPSFPALKSPDILREMFD